MTDESTSPAGTESTPTQPSTEGTKKVDADIRMSPEDMDRMDKYIAEQRKLSEAKALTISETDGEETEETSEVEKSDVEQAYEALQTKHKEFVERMRDNYLLGELPVKLQEEYKDRSFEELELLVEYLKKQSGKAGIPRIPKTKVDSKPKKDSGHVGGYDSAKKKWT